MQVIRTPLLLILLSVGATARPVSTVLTLQNDPIPGQPGKTYGVLDIAVSGFGISTSTTTTTLSGVVTAGFDVVSGQTSELTLSNGVIAATDFSASGTVTLGGNYTLDAQGLSGTFETPNPPGVVTAASGLFNANQHRFAVTSGTVQGSALGQNIFEEFTELEPFEGVGSGTGSVTLTPTGSSAVYDSYDVVVIVPGISVTDSITVVTILGSTTVTVTGTGSIKAVGTLDVPKSDYLAWTLAEGAPGASGQADANGDGVPNAIAWALGLGLMDSARDHVLRPANGGYELQLPVGGTVAPIHVEGSDLSSAFVPLAPGRLSAGVNPLPPGSTGLITLGRVAGEFVRLSVGE